MLLLIVRGPHRRLLLHCVLSRRIESRNNDRGYHPGLVLYDLLSNRQLLATGRVSASLDLHPLEVSRTGIFHVLFTLFFLTLTNTILQTGSYHPHHTRSNPFRPLTQFTDKRTTRVLIQGRSRHNDCTTTDSPFQDKTKLYSMRVKPPARPSTTTPPPRSENQPYRSVKSSPRRHPLACPMELEVPNGTRADR